MELSRYLKKSQATASRDCTIFKSWEDKRISTHRALELFKNNNDIRSDINITLAEFKSFMNSLGYYRGN